MIAAVPGENGKPGGFERALSAPDVAAAIAAKADGRILGTKRQDAALLVVFGCYESGLHKYAHGDGGKARGFLQLQQTPSYIAYDPPRAIDAWRIKALYSLDVCRGNPPGQRLAAVASGNCFQGRDLVAKRESLANRIAANQLVAPLTPE